MQKQKTLKNPQFSDILSTYSSYFKELRKRIIFLLIIFSIAAFIGFISYEPIVRLLIRFLSLEGVNIVFTSPFQFINLAMACGVATGLVVVFPFLIFQLLRFLKPALDKKEFKIITSFLPYSIFLFVVGFLFGAFIMSWQIDIFLTRSVSLGINNVLDISKLLSTIIMTSAFMGLGFQFPIVLLAFLRIGLVKSKSVGEKRMWIYLGSFFFAILLPADSILADVVLSLPLIILFEFTLLLNWLHQRKKPKNIAYL